MRTAEPVIAKLRNPNVCVEIDSTGSVIARCAGKQAVQIAACDPASSVFEAFMRFWQGTFASFSQSSLGLTQLVMDLAAGRMRQDADCPALFHDLTCPRYLEDEGCLYPLIEVLTNGLVRAYNPDTYVNEACVLAANPRIKCYPYIEDCDGHDFVTGMAVGIHYLPGERPVFDKLARAWRVDAIAAAAGILRPAA